MSETSKCDSSNDKRRNGDTPDDSVSAWIELVRNGDHQAAEHLWNRYFHKLVAVGQNQLARVPQSAANADDVAISAFKSFCRRAEKGEFPNLANRGDLWRLLLTIAIRKASKQARREKLRATADGSKLDNIELISPELTPDMQAEINDSIRHMMSRLKNPVLEQIAYARLEGRTYDETAELLGISVSAVDRKLRLIRRIWTEGGLV